jgi:hypothetical protein
VLRIADDDDLSAVIGPLQLAAAASPGTSITELVGNFLDLDKLLEQLSQPFVIKLGMPVPKDKHMPHKPAGACPTTHNDALIGQRQRGSA